MSKLPGSTQETDIMIYSILAMVRPLQGVKTDLSQCLVIDVMYSGIEGSDYSELKADK